MNMKFIIILTLITVGNCSDLLSDIFPNCGGNIKCAEADLIKQINDADGQISVPVIGEYFVLHKKKDAVEQRSRSFAEISERLSSFLGGYDMEIKFPSSMESVRKFITEARHSKLKKFIVPFVVLMILKKSIETPIFLAVVSLIAFKGLTAGLISLVLSAATAFKSLLDNHSTSKFSYEVVPQFQPSGPHWSRSGIDRTGIDYPNLSTDYHTIS